MSADTDTDAGATGPSDVEATVTEYHEVTNDEGVTEVVLHLHGGAEDRRATLTAMREGDGPLTVERFNDRSTTVFDRRAFGLFQAAVEELGRRGFAPDVGCLQFTEGDSPDKQNDAEMMEPTESLPSIDEDLPGPKDDAGQEEDTDRQDDADEQWCGICGDGPYSSLAIHHGRCHDGEPVPVAHEPTTDELVGKDDNAGDEETVEDSDDAREDWMPADPHEVVDGSPIRRPLEDFLTALEVEGSVVAVMRRVAATNTNQVREVAQDLGLTNGNGQLLENDVLQERIEKLREVA